MRSKTFVPFFQIFFGRKVNSKSPIIPFGIVACTLPTTFLEIAVYRVTERAYRGIFNGRSDTSLEFLNLKDSLNRHKGLVA